VRGYFAEGARTNYVPASATIDGNKVNDPFLGPQTWEVSLMAGEAKTIELPIVLDPPTAGLTFSCIASGPPTCSIRLAIGTAEERRIVRRAMNHADRIAVSMRFASATSEATASIELRNLSNVSVRVRVGFLQVEEGLFASSPILPGEWRDSDRLAYQRAQHFFETPEGTFLVLFEPNWHGHDLLAGEDPHLLSCRAEDGANSIDIYADSNSSGALTVRVVREGTEALVHTTVHFQKNRVYAVGLRYTTGSLELLVNGWSAGSFAIQLPAPHQLGAQVYLGVGANGYGGAFSTIADVRFWDQWLDERELQGVIYASAPMEFPWFYAAALAEQYSVSHWPQSIVQVLLRYPRIWQETPPPWLHGASKDESHFRDELRRSIASLGHLSLPEAHSADGRTDLLVKSSSDGSTLRVECKFWARHDYDEVPAKPLKYFTTGERFGAVLMLNQNKQKNIGVEYRRLVEGGEHGCVGIIDLPFGSTIQSDHFVSLHEAENGAPAEVLHLVMDIYGPFSMRSESAI
jgi:hypothetical protein